MEIARTDVEKALSYLDAAAKLYEAIPGQSCRCRAEMIRRLTAKLRKKYLNAK